MCRTAGFRAGGAEQCEGKALVNTVLKGLLLLASGRGSHHYLPQGWHRDILMKVRESVCLVVVVVVVVGGGEESVLIRTLEPHPLSIRRLYYYYCVT